MSQDFEDDDNQTDEEIDWGEHIHQDDTSSTIRPLDATDYVAIFIASLQTIFLPLILLMVIMVVIAFVLQALFILP
jgi:hypothetical protein